MNKEETNVMENVTDTTKPEWDKWFGFRFSDELTELFNTAAKLNALFVKLVETEYERWSGYGEKPEHFIDGFNEAMEYNTKCIHHLSEYAKQLLEYEMFEKFK